MMDPRRLHVLREVATRGSFSAAAEALAFTQSAVSQQVAALERETGTTLVDRGVRPVRLTDAGRALMVHAEAVLARLDEAQQELGEIARLRRGRLRLASIPTANATLVPRAIAEFGRRHPDVDLTVVDDHQQGLLSRLTRWELDLALVYDHESLPEPDVPLERTSLLDDPFDLVVPDGHPPARRRSPWRSSPTRPGSAAHRTAPTAGSCSTAAGRPASSHASPSGATTTTRCRPSSPSAWVSPSCPAWPSGSCARASPASPSPGRRCGGSPPPAWRPASAPRPPRRCSAC